MYDPEMRKDCPMRGTLGNCSPVGGFCVDAVSDEICEAVHNAYQQGYGHAIIRLKEQETKTGHWIQAEEDTNVWECSECGDMQIIIDGTPFENNWFFCPHCGANLVELIWKAGEVG